MDKPISSEPDQGFFITGTDTEIGKTFCAVALIHALRAQGRRVAGLKPVSAGCERTAHGLRNEDALALMAAADVDLDYETVNPYAFEPPVAPHLAARQAGVEMALPPILQSLETAQSQADHVIVEGAGGWLVPFNRTQTMADMAAALRLPVILVVGVRLGCINHALLTAQAIADAGLPLAGWIANRINPQADLQDENIETIGERIAAPLWGDLPYGDDPVVVAQRIGGFPRMIDNPSISPHRHEPKDASRS